VLCVIIVLFATAIAIDLSSLSLLLVFACSCWLDVIFCWLALGGLDMVLSVLLLFTCGACGCFLLFGSWVCIGVSIGLKKLVIGEFLFVLMPICFVVYVEQVLGLLWVVVDVVGVAVEVFLGCWGNTMVDIAPIGWQHSGYSFCYSTRLYWVTYCQSLGKCAPLVLKCHLISIPIQCTSHSCTSHLLVMDWSAFVPFWHVLIIAIAMAAGYECPCQIVSSTRRSTCQMKWLCTHWVGCVVPLR